MIKQFNLDRLWGQIRAESMSKIDQALTTGNVQNSKDVEVELCRITGRKYGIVTSNCTDALTIILRGMNYPKGSKILVPCYSFIATATPIILAGLTPVFVEVDHNYHLDLQQFTLESDIKAMLLVSLFGNPAEFSKYEDFCRSNGIDLIEDAAQSFGSFLGKDSGTAGVASAMSFSPTKPCPVLGSGGAILTDSEELAEAFKLGRLHGKTKNSDLTENVGINSMMSSSEAAQLLVGLKHKQEWQNRRSAIAEYYDDALAQLGNLPPRQGVHNWHKYVLRVDSPETLIEQAHKKGVQLAKHYSRLITDEPIFASEQSFSVSEQLRKSSVSLPICPHMSDSEVEIVAETVAACAQPIT